jgi:hypothetical protein
VGVAERGDPVRPGGVDLVAGRGNPKAGPPLHLPVQQVMCRQLEVGASWKPSGAVDNV